MTIRRNSKEELMNLTKWFLIHEGKIWKITEDKSDRILWILSQNNEIIKRKESVKNALSWVLSSDEFDDLYWKYIDYYASYKKKLKETILKIGIFPDKYGFLLHKFVRFVMYNIDDIDCFIEDLEKASSEHIDSCRTSLELCMDNIKKELSLLSEENLKEVDWMILFGWIDGDTEIISNIHVMKKLNIVEIDDLNKLVNIVVDWDPEKIESNISILRGRLWITEIDDLAKLENIIIRWDPEKIESNISILRGRLWITEIDDLAKLKDVIIRSYPEKIESNISILRGRLWITEIDDLAKLENIIIKWDPEKIESNISILRGKLWITEIDDLAKLEDVIINRDSEKMESSFYVSNELWIYSVDDFVKLYDLFEECPLDKIESNIPALRNVWIDDVDSFVKLIKLIKGCTPDKIESNIPALRNVWIDDVGSFVELITLIRGCTPDKIESNIPALKELWIDDIVSRIYYIDKIIISWNCENIRALKDLWIKLESKDSIGRLLHDNIQSIIVYWKPENLRCLKELGIIVNSLRDLRCEDVRDVIVYWNPRNLHALKNMDFSDFSIKDIGKLSPIITEWEPEKVQSNILILKELWFNPVDLILISDVIISWNSENMRALKDLWFEMTALNIDKLKSVIENGNPGSIRALREFWINFDVNEVEDINRLEEISSIDPETIIALNGLCKVDNTIDLLNLIRIFRYSDSNHIIAFKKLWIIHSVADFNSLRIFSDDYLNFINIIGSWRCEIIDMLAELHIIQSFENLIENIKGLENIIVNWKVENMKLLKDWWVEIKSVDDLVVFSKIIVDWKTENMSFLEDLWVKKEYISNNMGYLRKTIIEWKIENMKFLKNLWINVKSIEDIEKIEGVIVYWKIENMKFLKNWWINIKSIEDVEKMDYVITRWEIENMRFLKNLWINVKSIEDVEKIEEVIAYWKIENMKLLKKLWIDINTREWLRGIIVDWDPDIIKILIRKWLLLINNPDQNLKILEEVYDIIVNWNSENVKFVYKNFNLNWVSWLKKCKKLCCFERSLPLNLKLKEKCNEWYLKYIEEIIDFDTQYNVELISDILKLSLSEVDDYLRIFKKLCINQGLSYNKFLRCFDWKSFNWKLVDFVCKWFDIPNGEIRDDVWILNYSINILYPKLGIRFNENEAKKILWFVDNVWWINKWYSILILTMEKMVRDWTDIKDFNSILLKKIEDYQKVFDIYPEDKIPDWLKISIWLEFEMTKLYLDRYKDTTWNDYKEVVNRIVKYAKVGIEREWEYEFATKPSTNPMVALLEIHLLQELNLLDINDMQKLSWNVSVVKNKVLESWDDWWDSDMGVGYASRNGTWYHLNVWSDTDIWVSENIRFIQYLCTILPRWWISNGENVTYVNWYNNLGSKDSKFYVFPNSNDKNYVELRTYSVDDVELFEKNVIFNTYAIMWSQAQKKVSKVKSKIICELKDNENINSANDLMCYLEDNKLFKNNQDFKSRKIAAEFMFMQICVLRAINDYNRNFIDNELFSDEILPKLPDSWNTFFYDFLLSDQKETVWFEDRWWSSIVVKKYTNLKESFDVTKYKWKDKPFTIEETERLLEESWNVVDEKWIPYVTKWLNKRILWEILCNKYSDCEEGRSERLENKIRDKISNIDRIKSYIRWEEKNANLKIDMQYLRSYFKKNMSLVQFSPYRWVDTDFVNKIINLNNFFLKKDNANANGVLQTTVLNWDKDAEQDISKSSIFETWYMRKWYNYYQWWSENMLLHATQKIALDYMENVKNILNTDFDGDIEESVLKKAA